MARHSLLHAFVVMALIGTASACMCALPDGKNRREIAAAYVAKASELFEAKVLSVELAHGRASAPQDSLSLTVGGPTLSIRMQVLRTYRGSASNEVVVNMGGTNCDFDFDTGELYLVDAQRLKTGELFTSICSATSRLDEAGPELRVLWKQPPAAEDMLEYYDYAVWKENKGPKICGRVSRSDGTPLTFALVRVWKVLDDFRGIRKVDHAEFDKKTNTFCSHSLPPGRYFVGATDRIVPETNGEYRAYYPGTTRFSDAKPIVVKPATSVNDLVLVLNRVADLEEPDINPGLVF